jgi:hypothetical protein
MIGTAACETAGSLKANGTLTMGEPKHSSAKCGNFECPLSGAILV